MTKYRTKQTEVEAARLVDGANEDVMTWCAGQATQSHMEGRKFHVPKERGIPGETFGREWNRPANVGDWIVKADGGFSVLTDEAFRARYEEIKAEPAKAAAKATVAPAAEAKP